MIKEIGFFTLFTTFAWVAGAQTPGNAPSGSPGTPAFWKYALTPPMGWNSYDAFGDSVTESEVLENARYIQEHLLSHGWKYVVVDFRWYDPEITYSDMDLTRLRKGAALAADAYGRLLPAPKKFPSAADGTGFKHLADQLHSMGLKFGIHMMRGIPRQAVDRAVKIQGSTFTAADAGNPKSTCGWCPDMYGVNANEAGQAWYDSVFRLAAEWGLDFVKVDDAAGNYPEIAMVRKAIDRCGRPIVLSISAGAPEPRGSARDERIVTLANMWRISGDFWDEWRKLDAQFELVYRWRGAAGPGHWPDADMIPFGHIGIRNWTPNTPNPCERWTRFTEDEQRLLMSLWALAPSPLMLGMNLPDNDAKTLALLTNDEVIAVDQDPLGESAERIVTYYRTGGEIWIRGLANGSRVAGLFNRGDAPTELTFRFNEAGLSGKWRARDLWKRKDKGVVQDQFTENIAPHSALLIKLEPVSK
jgi:hypothetical protein